PHLSHRRRHLVGVLPPQQVDSEQYTGLKQNRQPCQRNKQRKPTFQRTPPRTRIFPFPDGRLAFQPPPRRRTVPSPAARPAYPCPRWSRPPPCPAPPSKRLRCRRGGRLPRRRCGLPPPCD